MNDKHLAPERMKLLMKVEEWCRQRNHVELFIDSKGRLAALRQEKYTEDDFRDELKDVA